MKLRTRARRVLQHIDRWWLTVPMVLDALFYEGNVASRKKEVAKLVSSGFLRSFPIYNNTVYYALGPTAQKQLAFKTHTNQRGFGPSRFPKYAAILDYCLMVEGNLTLLKREEFAAAFPKLSAGMESSQDRYVFELDSTGRPTRLVTFVVDSCIKLATLTTKVREVASVRDRNEAFRTLVDEAAFGLIVITHNADRAAQIRQTLASPRSKKCGVPVEVSVSPLLTRIVSDVRER